jgi:hypothetical protein
MSRVEMRAAVRLRVALLGGLSLVLLAAGDAPGAVICHDGYCVINNGLTPSDPENVIDDAAYLGESVVARNAGCPVTWPAVPAWEACASPGAATDVEVVAGAQLFSLTVLDNSTATINGGSLTAGVQASGSATVTLDVGADLTSVTATSSASLVMNGGLADRMTTWDSSVATMNGGQLRASLTTRGTSTVTWNTGWIMHSVDMYDTSTLVIHDGAAGVNGGTTLRDSSSITLGGGRVYSVDAMDASTVWIDGGAVFGFLYSLGSSTVTIAEGSVYGLSAEGTSHVTMTGATLQLSLVAEDNATIRMSGGEIWKNIWAGGSSLIEIVGTDFMVDGQPVPFGDLVALTGTLTGTLASSDPIGNTFFQGGYVSGSMASGTVRLVDASLPEPMLPGPGLLVALPILLAGAALAGRKLPATGLAARLRGPSRHGYPTRD